VSEWLKDYEDWIPGSAPPVQKKKSEKKEEGPAGGGSPPADRRAGASGGKKVTGDDAPMIVYNIIKCPICGSKKCRVYSVNKPLRYHRCENGHNFKSVEK
jgi:hypothetical protein